MSTEQYQDLLQQTGIDLFLLGVLIAAAATIIYVVLDRIERKIDKLLAARKEE